MIWPPTFPALKDDPSRFVFWPLSNITLVYFFCCLTISVEQETFIISMLHGWMRVPAVHGCMVGKPRRRMGNLGIDKINWGLAFKLWSQPIMSWFANTYELPECCCIKKSIVHVCLLKHALSYWYGYDVCGYESCLTQMYHNEDFPIKTNV
jgi:hypothetical protein